ncbi:aaa-domain-containing protein [Stemphylium lycopersici]|uniref:Aaa-domain-containing protein n=1 Tax=Stemphylium lycopersici TaxID=183478 RepID=A0A364N6B0_STELY|nr:aaa-domain-containing protein [Stemphylium lycopersici]RAR12800.1 aaa-domain-containing protein [Stemphylium lycopersici]
MRANTTQKAYDEAFLACSTAVYFEGQTALDHIYYHNSRRNPSTYRPASETERALIESLRQLELQCKERVDLLEALKKSRQESRESLASASSDNAPTPPPHGVPLSPNGANGPSSWIGGGSIPPIEYNDLSRPPPLPYRPALPPRKSSGTGSIRDNSLSQTRSASKLSPGPVAEEKTRTPSPEKSGRMLRTLRPGREGKSSAKMQSSLRSRPDASKAATQAWSVNTPSSFSRPVLGPTIPSTSSITASARSSIDKSAVDRPSAYSSNVDTQPPPAQAPFYFRAGEGSTSAAYAVPAPGGEVETEPVKPPSPRRTAPPIPRKAIDPGRSMGARLGNTAMPSYRKEYPRPTPDARTLATSAAAHSYGDNNGERGSVMWDPTTRRLVPKSTNTYSRVQTGSDQENSPEAIPLEEDGDMVKQRPSPVRKGRARGNSMRAELPDTPSTDSADAEQEPEETDEWKRRTDEIMKNLPRGVDKEAAKQILNEIVIQGDEVHWDDVSGLDVAKSALKETVVYPFLRPDLFMGLREPARGMLLFGPPGTGKTMLARAVATESKSTFFAISASSLTSKFLGESEKLVRALFQLAKMLAPSIIFVDEIDSLLSSRSGSGEHEATRRIKTEFLIQWSDLQKAAAGSAVTDKDKERGDATRVLVLAATNLPWAIDEAARRRFVRRQYIPLPEDWVRKQQVKTLLSHQKHGLSELDLDRLVALTEGFSGSDITALAKDAAMGPLRSLGEKLLSMTMDQIRPIQYQDFEASLQTIRPSVSKQGLKEFEDWATQFGKQNRPYSAIDVSANLHNKVTKAAAAKILKDLHEQKVIEGRAAGKQIVYHALQNAVEACTTEQLAALDTAILDYRAQTTSLNATAKTLRATLSSLNSTLSTADLIANVHALETERAEMEARLDGLRKGKAKKVTATEREAIEKEWKKSASVARKRAKISKEMWTIIEDALPDAQAKEEHREKFDLDG